MNARLLLAGLAAAAAAAAVPAAEKPGTADGWRSLFNGKDLSGWQTWSGKPNGGTEALGPDKDPLGVYSVVTVDGKPAVRISGEVFGAVTTRDEFEDYHLRLEFKWGEKRYPPREKQPRDSGLLYHCRGPHGAVGGAWMRSMECQIIQGDTGSFYCLGAGPEGGPRADATGEAGKGKMLFKPGGMPLTGVTRLTRAADHERPAGEWNTVDLYVARGAAAHVINGKLAAAVTHTRTKVGGREEPLTRGRIQLQSEAAEIFYRNLAVRPLEQVPDEYLK